MDKDDLQSLLRQAARIPGVEPKPEIPEEVLEKAVEVTESNMENKWEKIREAMEGPFAERFLKEMDGLSGREFIRVYGKMIEYFKPKIIRVEGERKEEEENVIRIEIHNSQPQQEVIDITHSEEENGTE
jgi:hypothetical protein